MSVNKKKEWKKELEAFTRRNILNAAIEVLKVKGFHGLTMELVAEKAGIAKGTLYLYFKNKDYILLAAVQETFTPLYNAVIEILDSDSSPDEKLKNFSVSQLHFFDINQELMRLFFYERENLPGKKTVHFEVNRYRTLINRVADVFKEGVDARIFIPLDSPVNAAAMFVEANMGLIKQRIYDRTSGKIEEDSEQFIRIFFNGLMRKV